MDSEYKQIFDTLYQLQPEPPYLNRLFHVFYRGEPSLGDERVVRKAIDDAETRLLESTGRRIRADAKYFLLLNVMNMIVVPVQMRRGGTSEPLDSYIRSDVGLIVGEASRLQDERERSSGSPLPMEVSSELSGHSVLEAVAANWKNLRLSEFQIWG
jgi:hypothetical protein